MKKDIITEHINNITSKNQYLFVVILLGVTIFGLYLKTLNAPFIFDDNIRIVDNQDIRKISNLKTKLLYPYRDGKRDYRRNDPSRPVTYASFTLNYYFGKLSPFGYHLVNISIHILIAFLIFILTKNLLFLTYRKNYLIFPLLTALLFAIHPINVTVVSYTFKRASQLSMLFYITALLLFIKAFTPKKRLLLYTLCIASFIFALESKPNAVTLPAIVLMFDFIFLSRFSLKEISKRKNWRN